MESVKLYVDLWGLSRLDVLLSRRAHEDGGRRGSNMAPKTTSMAIPKSANFVKHRVKRPYSYRPGLRRAQHSKGGLWLTLLANYVLSPSLFREELNERYNDLILVA